MSLGIVIANISAPLHQPVKDTAAAAASVAASATAAATDTVSNAANNAASGNSNSSAGGSNEPQLAPNFTVVVLQLLNEQGVVTSTIPSAQQLAAYRAGSAVPQN